MVPVEIAGRVENDPMPPGGAGRLHETLARIYIARKGRLPLARVTCYDGKCLQEWGSSPVPATARREAEDPP